MTQKEIIIDGVTYVPKQEPTEVEVKTLGVAIKNRWTGNIIFQSTKTTIKEAVIEAFDNARSTNTRADLTGADLTGADLTDADLTRANLTGADLTRANLTGADLTRANLTRANLTDADLTGADLTRANLTGADLTDADLTWTKFYFGYSGENFKTFIKYCKTCIFHGKEGEDWIE